ENPTDLLMTETQSAAQQMGLSVVTRRIANRDELSAAFVQYRQEQAQALIVQFSPLTFELRGQIAQLASRQRLPAMYEDRNFVDDGGLVSYGPDLQESYRRAATYVDRILKGAKPGELAMEQPAKYEMVINMKAATALGLTIPKSVLLRATDVIQ